MFIFTKCHAHQLRMVPKPDTLQMGLPLGAMTSKLSQYSPFNAVEALKKKQEHQRFVAIFISHVSREQISLQTSLYNIETLCRALCKNGCTDRDTDWDAESGASKEHTWGIDAHTGRGTFGDVWPIVKHRKADSCRLAGFVKC